MSNGDTADRKKNAPRASGVIKSKQVNVNFSVEEHGHLRAIAHRLGVSIASLCREIVMNTDLWKSPPKCDTIPDGDTK